MYRVAKLASSDYDIGLALTLQGILIYIKRNNAIINTTNGDPQHPLLDINIEVTLSPDLHTLLAVVELKVLGINSQRRLDPLLNATTPLATHSYKEHHHNSYDSSHYISSLSVNIILFRSTPLRSR